MDDLIRRSDVMKVLKTVFEKCNMQWTPEEKGRGFSSDVPNAIMKIPTVYENECIGCINEGEDCVHCSRAYSDCYERGE